MCACESSYHKCISYLLSPSVSFIHPDSSATHFFFSLVYSSLSASCCFSIAFPIYFSLAHSVLAFSLISFSIDAHYSFSFSSPSHVFLFFGAIIPTPCFICKFCPPHLYRCVFGCRSAATERPPHLRDKCKSTTPASVKCLNANYPEDRPVTLPPDFPDYISHSVRETRKGRGKSLFHFAVRAQSSCSL